MRLIDADRLTREICHDQCEKDGCGSHCELINYVENAPTVGGWISVKDRLPEKSQYVLVSLVNEIDGHRLKDPQIGYHTDDAGHSWFIASWNEWAIDSDFMVTHWQQMPEPPKEGEVE